MEIGALAQSTCTRYNSNNFAYIRWLLKKRPHLLHTQLKEELAVIDTQPLTPAKKEKKSDVWLGHGEMYKGMREPMA